MFATRQFKAGETILEEAPLFSSQFSWNFAYGYAACDFCMRFIYECYTLTVQSMFCEIGPSRLLKKMHKDCQEKLI